MLLISDNVSLIAGSTQALVFTPLSRIALVVDVSHPEEGNTGVPTILKELIQTNEECVNSFILDLELILEAFDDVIGKRPPIHHTGGRVRVEVAFLPGAAGLAHHGQAGIAVGPAFLQDCVKSRISTFSLTRHIVSHVFLYEFCRNYIFPEEFTNCFDYCCVSGCVKSRGEIGEKSEDCWGWINQEFVNVLGILIVFGNERLSHINVDYYGRSAEEFMTSMEAQLDKHISDNSLQWSDTFLHERLPWDQNSSLDNVYSGILVRLFKRFGGLMFFKNFFKDAIPMLHLNDRLPHSKNDTITARENFYLACSIAARTDLSSFFCNELRMPLDQSCKDICSLFIFSL